MSAMQRRIHRDHSERKTTFVVSQDVQPILDWNKALRSERQKSDWGRHLASVPNVLINKWLQEEWEAGNVDLKYGSDEWMKLVWRKLQDPDYKFLRVDY